MSKVVLIVADGMRADAIQGIEQVEKFKKISTYTTNAKTVFPSMTLPCHMSLFHSVDPIRHGVTTNVFTPQVRPVVGLAETLKMAGKKSAVFYTWEELKDITRPSSLAYSLFFKDSDEVDKVNQKITTEGLRLIKEEFPDFVFLYYHAPDILGHKKGWMSKEYLDAVKGVWEHIEKVVNALPKEYSVIITADHGGHDRTHGTTMQEDLTIPLFMVGEKFARGKVIENASIIDIAPTIVKILGVNPNEEWEGRALC
jgi:predicted AlkP superfamily pyrophosphatase or phosphodiesterase